MTAEEIEDWLRTRSLKEVIVYLVTADDWENSTPKLEFPDVYAFLDKKGDLYVTFENKMLMTIGTISPLIYSWTIAEHTIEDFYVKEKKPKWPWFAVGGGCLLGGFVLGVLIR